MHAKWRVYFTVKTTPRAKAPAKRAEQAAASSHSQLLVQRLCSPLLSLANENACEVVDAGSHGRVVVTQLPAAFEQASTAEHGKAGSDVQQTGPDDQEGEHHALLQDEAYVLVRRLGSSVLSSPPPRDTFA